jgi:alkyl sulfatase BDS1-like metallo-beta-lactamase superfamily hydrolase
MHTLIAKHFRSLDDSYVIIATVLFFTFIILSFGYFQLAFSQDLNNSGVNRPMENAINNASSFSPLSGYGDQKYEGLPYPEIEWVNPSAVEQAKIFLPPRIEKVTDGVFATIGYGVANVMMIEGNDGIIIVDTGNNIDQAKKTIQEFRSITSKPVVAVIYTNSHADHTGGAGVFVEDGLKSGNVVNVIGQKSLLDAYYSSYGMMSPHRSVANMFWGGLMLPSNSNSNNNNDTDSVISYGIGPPWMGGNRSFIKPNISFNDTYVANISGVPLELIHAPGESPDGIIVWLPKKRVLLAGDNIYKAYPDLSPITGAKHKDIPQWINSLDKMRSMNASYLVPSHTMPVIGQQNVTDILTAYRDGIAFVYDQTIRHINKGLTPDELVQAIVLPQYLRDHPWLQERYGQLSWSIRGIYSDLVGWNTGDATWFNPVTTEERGNKIIQSVGGLDRAISLIRASIKDGDYKWATELATYVLYAEPDNAQAKSLKAGALRIMGWKSPTSGARNWYLTQANILDGNINATTIMNQPKYNTIEQVASTVPIKNLLSLLQYRLDPLKSQNATATVGIYLNDTKTGYALEIRRAVLEYKDSFPSKYDVALYTNSDTLRQILLGQLSLQEALDLGVAKIVGGNISDLNNIASLFEYRLKSPIHRIQGAD